jgi:hypothetical protein
MEIREGPVYLKASSVSSHAGRDDGRYERDQERDPPVLEYPHETMNVCDRSDGSNRQPELRIAHHLVVIAFMQSSQASFIASARVRFPAYTLATMDRVVSPGMGIFSYAAA